MRASVGSGVGVALGLSFAGSVLHGVATPMIGLTPATLACLLAGIYVLYLLSAASVRIGRVTSALLWCVLTAALVLSDTSLWAVLCAQTLMISLIRCLYYHNGVLPALIDVLLGLFALAASVWAFGHTGSLLVAIWCFFLTQAAFVLIPARGTSDRTTRPSFTEAHRAADQAIARMASR